MIKILKEGILLHRKVFIIGTILLLTVNISLFSMITPSLRYMAMGESGVALFDNPSSFQINPAALYFQEPSLFTLNIAASEIIYDDATINPLDPIKTMQHPITLIEFLFATRYSALLVGFGFDLQNRAVATNGLTFTSYNDSYIQLNVAYGFPHFSIGLYAKSGSRLQRSLISIDKDSAFTDYIAQVYLNRYNPSNDGQLFKTGLGFLITYPFISLALLTDSLFIVNEDNNNLVLDFTTLLSDTKIGLALHTTEYDTNNELNLFLLTTSFDITNLADESSRSVHLGFECKAQLLKDLNIAIQVGYKENRGLPSPLFGFNWDGTSSFGISSQFYSILLDVVLLVPSTWYSPSISSDPLNLLLSFHYQF